uniref:R-specific alcohol dehydrogenase n=1 Tax=[Candida] maris TaxID=50260 RepID=F5HSY1_9ASCO|nr:R-specific alcohol dehydrogenase [[Candida] maris]
MSYNFANKVLIVTGGLSGIGLAVAKKFLQLGAKVTISDISATEKYNTVVGEFKTEGIDVKNVQYIQADASKEADNEKLISETLSAFGDLDYVCANAGIATFTQTTDISYDVWRKVTSINLDGVFMLDKLAAQYFLSKNKPGAIVNMGSIHSYVAAPGLSHYGAAKGGLKLLTQTMALEYAAKGIRVNSVNPGYIKTPLLDICPKEHMDYLITQHPIGRLGKPEEIASAVAFLCSDEATFINGISLLVDGGYTAR